LIHISSAVGMGRPEDRQVERLTEALRNNENWAVAEVAKRVEPIIRNKIYSFDDWEDVLQECLMEVVVAVRTCATVKNLWGLVKRVAVTSVIDHNRGHLRSRERTSRRTAQGSREPTYSTDRLRDRHPLPDAVLESRDLFLYIYQRFGKTCQEIADLIYIEGVSYERAATKLGIQDGALRVRIHRCRERAMQLRDEAVELQ
jgi:RNA polymerase sigma factor (sigma-70 family)